MPGTQKPFNVAGLPGTQDEGKDKALIKKEKK